VLEHDWAPMQERLEVMFGTVRTALLGRFRDLDGQIGIHPTVADLYFFGSLSLWRDLSQDEHGLLQVAVVVGSDVPQGPVKASPVFDQGDPGKAVFEMSTRDVGTIGRIEHPILAGATTGEISAASSDFLDVVEAALPAYTATAVRVLAEEPNET